MRPSTLPPPPKLTEHLVRNGLTQIMADANFDTYVQKQINNFVKRMKEETLTKAQAKGLTNQVKTLCAKECRSTRQKGLKA